MQSVALRSAEAQWLSAPAHPSLPAGETHVWRASLERGGAQRAALYDTLSGDERARADRFHFERDRNHFIVARGILRQLLARYLGCQPAELGFVYGPRGKPAVATPVMRGGSLVQDAALHFNLSHSHGLALFAFARGAELGVDVEHIRPDFDSAEIAERFFSAREQAELRALPSAQRAEAFFNGWTRKEAYIKAMGAGLSIALDSFDVTLAPGAPARLLAVRGAPAESPRMCLYALHPGPDFAAALVVAGHSAAPMLFALE